MATIRVNKQTYIDPTTEKYALKFTALVGTTGIPDLGLFVFLYKTDGSVFDHVASAIDFYRHPLGTPVPGNQFFRETSVTFLFDTAFDASDVETRVFDDLKALEANLDSIAVLYDSNIDYTVANGVVTNDNP